MVINCEEVWRHVSDYLDGALDAELGATIEQHIHGCQRCTAVLDGMRNVVQLYGDERMMEVPLGYSRRLRQHLDSNMSPSRRSFLGWMVAAAASILVAGGIELARSSSFTSALRSPHARASNRVPPDLMVIVAIDGKTFHAAGCPFIHDKSHLRTISARQAEQEGYNPCVRCMKKYLAGTISTPTSSADQSA